MVLTTDFTSSLHLLGLCYLSSRARVTFYGTLHGIIYLFFILSDLMSSS